MCLIPRKTDIISVLCKISFYASIALIIFINVINIKQPILEEHSFRQTQTALTAYYLKSNGFSLEYQTPVVGEPWSIPFEFPVYQYIVAKTSAIMDLPLTATGRLISLIFVLLTCIPIYFALNRLHIENSAIYFSLALFLCSPIYLFWAGTFMIESAALFFTCSFLYYATKISERDWTNRNFIFFSLFLTLALLQKVTTALPCLFLISLVLIFFTLRAEDFYKKTSSLIKLVSSIFLPILIGYLWIKYSDNIKMQNPIGVRLTSSNLSSWNYGPLGLRLSLAFWRDIIFDRNIKASSFQLFGLAFIFTAFFIAKDKILKLTIASSLFLFIFPFFVFSNLHNIHNYYQIANSVFLSISLGISIIYVCNLFLPDKRIIYGFILISFLLSNLFFFHKQYSYKKFKAISSDNKTLLISEYIKNNTPKDLPIIWFGFGWSSEAAFYSERKSLTVPDWDNIYIEAVANTGIFLKDKPSAIVLCPSKKDITMIKTAINKKYEIIHSKNISNCEVYLIGTAKQ